MTSWDMLLQIILLLLGCLAAGTIMARLGQSPLVGYLLAGMLLGGPGSLSIVTAEDQIESIAELGVALLLFSLGLEFSWPRLVALGRKTLIAGALQVLLTLLLISAACLLYSRDIRGAIAIGAMLSLSSTATVLRALIEASELDSPRGRTSLAILLVQDLAVLPLAIMVPLLQPGGDSAAQLVRAAGVILAAIGVIVVLYIVLRYAALQAWRTAAFARHRELSVLLAVIVGLGATWAAHAAGLSPALGAFAAGMFLGSSPFAVQVRADVASLRIILLTLFFGAVGLVADPVWMLKNAPLVLLTAGLIMSAKLAVLWLVLRWLGQSNSVALASGLGLCQVGEFAFVLGNEAITAGVLSEQIYSLLVSSSVVTLLLTPTLIRFAPALAAKAFRAMPQPGDADTAGNDTGPSHGILVIGFGPAGRGAVSQIPTGSASVTVIELSPDGAAAAEAMGFHGLVGDASSPEVLEHLPLSSIGTVVITLPSQQDCLVILRLVRQLMPHATTIVRSRYQRFMDDLHQAGAGIVVGDEFETGQALARAVAKHLLPGVPDDTVLSPPPG
jgi:CPA2 family monovalent cation:H+ antiporter-2